MPHKRQRLNVPLTPQLWSYAKQEPVCVSVWTDPSSWQGLPGPVVFEVAETRGWLSRRNLCAVVAAPASQWEKQWWLAARMTQSIFKKHLRPSEQSQKTCSAWILGSLRGGFLCFLPSPSVCCLTDPQFLLVCRPPLLRIQHLQFASYFIWPFFSFSFCRRIYINTAPFVPSSHSHISLPPHPLPWFTRV